MSISMGGSSGINTDQMVQQLMYLERQPIRRMEDEKEGINKKISAWQELNTKLDTFRTEAENIFKNDVTSFDNAFDQMTTSSSDEDVVTASVDSTASSGSYNVKVTSGTLATKERVQLLSQQDIDDGKIDNGDDFDINGQAIDLSATDTLEDIKGKVNDAGAGVTASIIDNKLVVESNETGASNRITFTDSDGDNNNGSGFLEGDLGLDLEDGVTTAGTVKLGTTPLLQEATDVTLEVNGVSMTKGSNEITDAVEGVTFNLNGKIGTTATVDISKDTEGIKEKVKGFVESYNSLHGKLADYGGKEGKLQGDATLKTLESRLYNSIIAPSNSVTSTKKLDSNPLSWSAGTDKTLDIGGEQVQLDGGMSTSDIVSEIEGTAGVKEVYEEDSRLVIEGQDGPVDLSASDAQVLKDLKLPDKFERNTGSMIGLSVNDDGSLSLNESDFESALENNLSDVKQMFTGADGIVPRVKEEVEQAIGLGIYSAGGSSYDGYVKERTSTLQDEISSINDSIENTEDRLEIRRENLKQKFTRMKQTINEMQSQQSWLSSQLGSMGL